MVPSDLLSEHHQEWGPGNCPSSPLPRDCGLRVPSPCPGLPPAVRSAPCGHSRCISHSCFLPLQPKVMKTECSEVARRAQLRVETHVHSHLGVAALLHVQGVALRPSCPVLGTRQPTPWQTLFSPALPSRRTRRLPTGWEVSPHLSLPSPLLSLSFKPF